MLLASHTGSGKTLAYLLPLVSCAPDTQATHLAISSTLFCAAWSHTLLFVPP